MGLQLDAEGYALLPGLLDAGMARSLALQVTAPGARRVTLESSDLGRGELFYFGVGMPAPLEAWRTALYRRLAVIANRWNKILGIALRYPAELDDLLSPGGTQTQRAPSGDGETRGVTPRQAPSSWPDQRANAAHASSYLSRLGTEDFMALHQRHNGERIFPLQIVALLSEPGADFQGGEFVMTEQRPRMQSRPMVLPLQLGDAAIITTAERPFRGARGDYRVNLRHAISRVRGGERIGLELVFHDGPQRCG